MLFALLHWVADVSKGRRRTRVSPPSRTCFGDESAYKEASCSGRSTQTGARSTLLPDADSYDAALTAQESNATSVVALCFAGRAH